jgi:Kef-type K+ transport system membrane component KefB
MNDPDPLRHLGYLLIAAAIAGILSRSVRMPTLVAYLACGLALGPATGLVRYTHTLEVIAEVGVALLLFLVGMELTVARIRDVGRVAVVAGVLQVAVTATAATAAALLLRFTVRDALFLGIALTFSSTVVVVKLLKEKGELDAVYGRVAVGILLVQDLVVILVLTLVSGVGTDGAISVAGVAGGVLQALGGVVILLGATVVAARRILPAAFAWIAAAPRAVLVWSLAWCFLLVTAAGALRLSPEIGAFLAGVALAQLPHAHDLRRRVAPLTSFFVAVFFLSLGVRVQPAAALGLALPAGVLTLFVLLVRPLLFRWSIARAGADGRVAGLTAISMAQTSEFSFVLAALAVGSGLVGEEILALVAVVGIATMSVSSYMIQYNRGLLHRLGGRPEGRGPSAAGGADEPEEREAPPRGHVIVVGMNALGRRIVEALQARGESVVAVDQQAAALAGMTCPTFTGKAEHLAVMEEAGLSGARLLVSALRIEESNRLLVHYAAQLGVPASVHAFHADAAAELASAGADHLMVPREDGTGRLLELMREHGVLHGRVR